MKALNSVPTWVFEVTSFVKVIPMNSEAGKLSLPLVDLGNSSRPAFLNLHTCGGLVFTVEDA